MNDKLNSTSYIPQVVPDDVTQIPQFLRDQQVQIQAAIASLVQNRYEKTYVAPAKPRDGDVAYADGTYWNPGSGAGLYQYNGTAWSVIGGGSSGGGSGGGSAGSNAFIMKNRLINGAMNISQRNYFSSLTPVSGATFILDRWKFYASQDSIFKFQQNLGNIAPPVGFANYLGITTASSFTIGAGDLFFISQGIEGFNFYDLAFGSSSAKTVTLSFWVYSSVTGTFGGSLLSSAYRSYPFTYSISAANTWTQISITIPGDTTGTWDGATVNLGCRVSFGLGVGDTYSGTANTWSSGPHFSTTGATSLAGTSGANFYITGIQLEAGSAATSYDFRMYEQELTLCQRYYFTDDYQSSGASYGSVGTGVNSNTTTASVHYFAPQPMRLAPNVTSTGSFVDMVSGKSGTSWAIDFDRSTTRSFCINLTYSSGAVTSGAPCYITANNSTTWKLGFESEL